MSVPPSTGLERRGPLSRFFRAGIRDAESRLARLTAPTPLDETRVIPLLQSSAALGVLDRLFWLFRRASDSSVLAVAARRAVAEWSRLPSSAQRSAAGTILLAGALTHLSLIYSERVPPGWAWLILPSMAAVIGGALLAAPRRPTS